MKLRSAVYGGITRQPRLLTAFFRDVDALINRAHRIGLSRIDIAVVDEVESGSGMNCLAKHLRTMLARRGASNPSYQLDLVVTRFLIKRPTGLHPSRFLAALKNAPGRFGQIRLNFREILLVGPIFTYDDAQLLGIKRTRRGYAPILYSVVEMKMRCPRTRADVYYSWPGRNDTPTYLGNFASDLAQRRRYPNVVHLRSGLLASGCTACKAFRRVI